MVPKIGEEVGIGGALHCPHCKGDYLHHHLVEVFERQQDAPEGLRVSIEHDVVLTDTCMDGNPSARRNGLIIHFECENCEARSKLEIVQHKGQTFVEMSYERPVMAIVSVR